MELKMEVYSPSLELLGLLETYDSLIIEEWAFKPGSFSLESILNDTTRELLKPENIIWLEGETAGIIEFVQASVSESGYILSVKGSLLAGILSRRILWGTYNLYGSPTKIMYDVVQDCAISPTRGNATQRIIPNLALAEEPPEDTRRICKQSTGDILTDFLTEVGQVNGVAYGVTFNAFVPQMEFWARVGVDRTINQTAVEPVLYSTELDDVLSSEYSYDSSQYRNIALVAGEGEGDSRKQAVVSVDAQSFLPDGYIQLEYIQSTGEQYIITNHKPNQDTKIRVKLMALQDDSSRSIAHTNGGWLKNDFGIGTSFISFGSQSTGKQGFPMIKGTIQTIELSADGALIDNELVWLPETQTFQSAYELGVFCLYRGSVSEQISARLYYLSLWQNGALVHNFIPCTTLSGSIGLYDLVTATFFPNSGTGEFIAGPIIDVGSFSGLSRRESFVDARDLQNNADPDDPMTDEEYTEALTTRGEEKLSDCQLVQSFSATVRTLNPTYEYGVDFFLGDTITVTDERLGISVDAVVEGVERSVGKNGEDMILTLGYGLPTISDRLRKAGV